jgi:hypothetical protein
MILLHLETFIYENFLQLFSDISIFKILEHFLLKSESLMIFVFGNQNIMNFIETNTCNFRSNFWLKEIYFCNNKKFFWIIVVFSLWFETFICCSDFLKTFFILWNICYFLSSLVLNLIIHLINCKLYDVLSQWTF